MERTMTNRFAFTTITTAAQAGRVVVRERETQQG